MARGKLKGLSVAPKVSTEAHAKKPAVGAKGGAKSGGKVAKGHGKGKARPRGKSGGKGEVAGREPSGGDEGRRQKGGGKPSGKGRSSSSSRRREKAARKGAGEALPRRDSSGQKGTGKAGGKSSTKVSGKFAKKASGKWRGGKAGGTDAGKGKKGAGKASDTPGGGKGGGRRRAAAEGRGAAEAEEPQQSRRQWQRRDPAGEASAGAPARGNKKRKKGRGPGANQPADGWSGAKQQPVDASPGSLQAKPMAPQSKNRQATEPQTAKLAAPQCKNRHTMERRSTNPRGYKNQAACDACGLENLPKKREYFFHCSFCKFDLCPKCSTEYKPESRSAARKRRKKELEAFAEADKKKDELEDTEALLKKARAAVEGGYSKARRELWMPTEETAVARAPLELPTVVQGWVEGVPV